MTRHLGDQGYPARPRQEALSELWAILIGGLGRRAPISAGILRLAGATLAFPHDLLHPSRTSVTSLVSMLRYLELPGHCDLSTCSSFLEVQVAARASTTVGRW